MSGQAASVGSLLSALLLSDHRVLRCSWERPFRQPLRWLELREPTYLAHQSWAARFPDHVFESAWRLLVSREGHDQSVLLAVLQSLIKEFLDPQSGEVRVRSGLLGAWQQGVASRVSSLPILAAADVLFEAKRYYADEARSVREDASTAPWKRHILPLLRPEDPDIDSYVKREGLHETHLHLNGSTHAEICWLRAIRDPHTETRTFLAAWRKSQHTGLIRELVAQVNPELTPQMFYRHLLTASRLRAWLVGAARDQLRPKALLPISCSWLSTAGNDEWMAGLREPLPSWRYESDIESEITWMANLVAILRKRPNVQLERMFHAYVLLLNEHYRLLVQSEAQYGFDQFQKFTLTELREPAERDYRIRFQAMHGMRLSTSTVGYLEGRFAPKADPLRACRLFQAILSGYLAYLNDAAQGSSGRRSPRSLSGLLAELDQYVQPPLEAARSYHRLTLVAHFIKQPWPPKHGPVGSYRHHPLDMHLRQTTGVLLSVLARWPRLKKWVTGIDAAANELHAPPELFATVFRVCREAGIPGRTYHAGEDFRHLLSGIATMWEALTLLDLNAGDRIGHGTAMGISPSLWLERMPARLILSRGEWMLALLAAWQLLRNLPEMSGVANKVHAELAELAKYIFDRQLNISDLERAMSLRGLSRRDLMRHMLGHAEHHESLNEGWRKEAQLVSSSLIGQRSDVETLWEWLSDQKLLARSEELIETQASYLSAAEYVQLQQALMREVFERKVIVETLPSSNVRISQYHHMGEHHALRWMGDPGSIESGDADIRVCLGSDDPGIFAGDLETEFYLLHAELRKSGLSSLDALKAVSALNENGRTYRFHHQQSVSNPA